MAELEYKTAELRRPLGWISTLLTTVLIANSITIYLQNHSLDGLFREPILIAILILWISSSLIYLSWRKIDWLFWRLLWRIRFRNPAIGILAENNLRPIGSKYGPNAWKRAFTDIDYETNEISVRDSFKKCRMVINPYGEGYPEENIVTLRSFSKFCNFVYNGGIFVSIGGYPFFWAFDLGSGERICAGKPFSEGYSGIINSNNPTNIVFTKVIDRSKVSLYEDAILWKKFHLMTNWGDSCKVKIHQEDKDQELVGDLIGLIGTHEVEQFRAPVSPVPGCRPILRAKLDAYGEIYPLLAIEYGRGYFIIGGMNLEKVGEAETSFKFCKEAIRGLINGIRNGTIPPHDSRINSEISSN